MDHEWVNQDLARWFAQPASRDYGFYVRIVGSVLELHAEHFWTGQRYVARARHMDEAAPELLRMISAYPPAARHPADDAASPAGTMAGTSAVGRAWKQASRALGRIYAAVAG